eukprot:EG_transcript_6793
MVVGAPRAWLAPRPSAPPETVEARHLRYAVPGRGGGAVQILRGVDFAASPGQLVAVLGPPGVGKSALLNILCGRLTRGVEGFLLVAGARVPLAYLRRRGALAPAADELLPWLTPRTALDHAAGLRLPTGGLRGRRPREVIQELGMQGFADLQCGMLSPGQRKRTSVALELITGPQALFVDDYDAGLDERAARKEIEVLKGLAGSGLLVMCALRRPSFAILQLFHRVLLLGNGQAAYFGPVAESVVHFSLLGHPCPAHCNPAEFFVELLQGPATEKLVTLWQDRSPPASRPPCGEAAEMEVEGHCSQWCVSVWLQYWVLAQRTCSGVVRGPSPFWQTCAGVVGAALLFGAIFYRLPNTQQAVSDRLAVLFLAAVFSAAHAALASAKEVSAEFHVVLHEHRRGYYCLACYLLARLTVAFVFQALWASLFLGVLHLLVGLLPLQGPPGNALVVLLLLRCIGTALGLGVGARLPRGHSPAGAVGWALLLPVLFGGFLRAARSANVFVVWLQQLSFLRYGLEALAMLEFEGRDLEACILLPPKRGEMVRCPYGPGVRRGRLVLQDLGLDSTVNRCVTVLLLWLGVSVMFAFVTLASSLRRNRFEITS